MYGKLFAQMYDGTLGTRGPWQALVTFQQLIILADKHGQVDMTAEAIARRTTIPADVITAGIAALELPDPESRSPDEGGRRIVRIDPERSWGWRIVNYSHYRKIRTEEERREYHRNYMRNRRKSSNSNGVTSREGVNTSLSDSTNSSKQYAGSSMQEDAVASSATAAAPHEGCFTDPAHRSAYLSLRTACQHPPSWDAALGALLEGVADRPVPAEALGAALMDMAAKGVRPSPSALGKFARRARAEAERGPDPDRGGPADDPNPFLTLERRLRAKEPTRG